MDLRLLCEVEIREGISKNLGNGKWEYKGKKGVWRTDKSGDRMFWPDDGAGPMGISAPKAAAIGVPDDGGKDDGPKLPDFGTWGSDDASGVVVGFSDAQREAIQAWEDNPRERAKKFEKDLLGALSKAVGSGVRDGQIGSEANRDGGYSTKEFPETPIEDIEKAIEPILKKFGFEPWSGLGGQRGQRGEYKLPQLRGARGTSPRETGGLAELFIGSEGMRFTWGDEV